MLEMLSASTTKAATKPNILFFLVDEWRADTVYESDELKAWKDEHLKFQKEIASKGTVFHRHYTNSCSCAPARTTIHTGHYTNIHGVTQTPGAAKASNSPGTTWLKPFTVPTMGNYFRLNGYSTFLKGKWHVSDTSIALGDTSYLTSFNAEGKPIRELEQFYLEKNVLHDFGYDGWVGPEPHGSSPLNSGASVQYPTLGRDVKFTAQAVRKIKELDSKGNAEPWLMMVAYTNPHDICFYGILSRESGWDFTIDPSLPEKLFTDDFDRSLNDSLLTKPPAQLNYKLLYPRVFQPILDVDLYQRYYYTIQKRVDAEMHRVWHALQKSSMSENTIVVFTSDHGDLLASHGGMHQKFYQAYEETIHVPLVISSKIFGEKHQDIYNLTTHIDLLPTLLECAKINKEKSRQKLGQQFSLNIPLPGRSLLPFILDPNISANMPVYFYTEDNPTEGPLQFAGLTCLPYESVHQPASVEAIVVFLENELWKITHYYNPAGSCGNLDGVEYEIYNITSDPMELVNLYDNKLIAATQAILLNLLRRASSRYRIVTGEKKPDDQSGGEGSRSLSTKEKPCPCGKNDKAHCTCHEIVQS